MQFFIQLFVLLILAVALCYGGGCIGKDSSESPNANKKTIIHARSASFNDEENSIYYDANGDSFNANRNQNSIYHGAQIGGSFNAGDSKNSIYHGAQIGGSFNAGDSKRIYYDATNGDSFNASSRKFEKVDLKKKEYDKEAKVYYARKNSKRKNQ